MSDQRPTPGMVISNYRIIAELGRGGMGVVYKAQDLKLGRDVAIKVIAPRLDGDARAARRLLNEARAACRLDSRYICTVHQVDETADGQVFVVMAYYEGETLAEKLTRGPLPVEVATRYALQIGRGLAVAHEAGIVHCDVKPANVLVDRRDEVKLLDFGLAKVQNLSGVASTNGSGGTPAYMAPEQIRGETPDARTDVWALGVLLAECLTGRRPFQGDAPAVVMFNILNAEPPALRAMVAAIPEELEAVVRRALAKDPADRYQSVPEMLQDLDPSLSPTYYSPGLPLPVPAVPPARRAPSILVLPFENLSAEDESYFGEGLMEEIIADLSGISGVRVISRTSAMLLRGSQKDIKTIARDLSVSHVLEGTVRKREGHFRITAKLIDAARDTPIWAEKYGGTLDDVFEVQERLSRKIVDALSLKLDPGDEKRIALRPIDDPRAYDGYLRAKQEMLRYSKPALDRALDFLQKSEQIVGDNVVLAAAIGQVYWQYVNAGASSSESYLRKAREYARKAQAIDAESPHCHRLLGLIRLQEGDSPGAIRGLKVALEKDPYDTEAMAWLIPCYAFAGRPEAAAAVARRLLELDPLTPIYQMCPGIAATMAGDFEGAVEPWRIARRMDMGNTALCFGFAHTAVLAGLLDEARGALKECERLEPDGFFGKLAGVLLAALRRDAAVVHAAAADEVGDGAKGDAQYSWIMAQCLALVGSTGEAIEWLRIAMSRGLLNYPLISRLDPLLAGLREEPRFLALMEVMKQRWEDLDV